MNRIMSEQIIKVMCIDDHRLMREGIVRIIGMDSHVSVVAEGSTGEEAIALFLKFRPDVTLMDLELRAGMNGLQAIRAIREIDRNARIVVLTMYEGDENIYRALQAGAAGYLVKDSVPEELLNVIREVHAGRRSLPSFIEAKLEARSGQPSLTAREVEVLELLATGKRNKEIASALQISEETTRAHIKTIFLKLNVHDRTAALSEALRRGFVHMQR
jgi:DNA-binding NarL/FixJ family response regulator